MGCFRPEIKRAGGEPVGAKRGSKQTYIQVVFTAMVEGKEDEFNAFYDNHRAPELAAIPGFVSAQRMILARPSNSSIPPTKYLALFRVETSDLDAVKQVAWERLGWRSWIFAEANNMGGPIIEQLRRDGLPVTAFNTNNASKAAAIEALALAFERGTITIPNDPALIGELQAFEAKPLPSGRTRYAAPEGLHGDCVISLALAWQGLATWFEHRAQRVIEMEPVRISLV